MSDRPTGYVGMWTGRKDAKVVTLAEYLAMPDDQARAGHTKLLLDLPAMLAWANARVDLAPKVGPDERRVDQIVRQVTRHDHAQAERDPEKPLDLAEEEVYMLCRE